MASTCSLPLASASIAAALLVYLLLSRSRRAPIAPIVLPPKEAANGVLRDFVVERVLRRRGALHIFETLPPKHTALVIIDMQRDFVPGDPLTNPQGGRFGVAEGNHCVPPIVHMIDAAAKAGALVGATRDYHPHDHASFMPQGGPFPPHCVQGTAGARFMPEIAAALAREPETSLSLC